LDRAISKLPFELGPFVYGRLQNLQTSEVTFAHVITPLISKNMKLAEGERIVDDGFSKNITMISSW